jgi:hypothetical protein
MEAKKLRRGISKFDIRKDWESVKDQVMLDVLRAKFANGVMREQMLNSGAALMVNGNIHRDNYRGICRWLSAPSEEWKYGTSAACNGTGLNRSCCPLHFRPSATPPRKIIRLIDGTGEQTEEGAGEQPAPVSSAA